MSENTLDMRLDLSLDVTQMSCPLPLIRIKKAVKDMKPGAVLQVVGNDPIFEETVKDFCEENKHEIVGRNQEGRNVTLLIKV